MTNKREETNWIPGRIAPSSVVRLGVLALLLSQVGCANRNGTPPDGTPTNGADGSGVGGNEGADGGVGNEASGDMGAGSTPDAGADGNVGDPGSTGSDGGAGGTDAGGADSGGDAAGDPAVSNAAASVPRCPVGSRTPGGGQLLPVDGTLHCAGQSLSDFSAYSAIMPAASKPAVYMTYVSLREDWGVDHATWAAGVASEIAQFPEFMSLQVGLSMTADGPETHYEADVANGTLDDKLNRFIDALEGLARPVYLRVGYEFNGTPWNGYLPQSYQEAFRHIATRVRARGLEVALVWDAVTGGGDPDFMAYYPGDDFVDWWGINVFSPFDFGSPLLSSFLASAGQAVPPKPVMLGEATPATVGVLGGQTSWDLWFTPYFDLIQQQRSIRMSCYINTDWTTSSLSDWGDARIQQNSTVSQNYVNEMASSIYRHGTSELLQRSRFGLLDTTAPAVITGLRANPDAPQLLEWDCLDDAGLAAYLVEREGVPVGRTLYGGFIDRSLRVGQRANFSVRAIDRAGNLGPPSMFEYQMPRRCSESSTGASKRI